MPRSVENPTWINARLVKGHTQKLRDTCVALLPFLYRFAFSATAFRHDEGMLEKKEHAEFRKRRVFNGKLDPILRGLLVCHRRVFQKVWRISFLFLQKF